MPFTVARARLEEVQPLARAYAADDTVRGVKQPPLPSRGIYWVARRDDAPVGYAAGTLSPDGLVLGPIYVVPAARRSGVAAALLDDVQRWADSTRVPVTEVAVAADNAPGLKFLEAAGYRPRRILMSREEPRP